MTPIEQQESVAQDLAAAHAAEAQGDDPTALHLWRTLAERGVAEAQYAVGEILNRGELTSTRPSGAFYVWTDVSEAEMPSMDLARSLIEREHVAVAPGSAFGELGEGYVRLSLASSREDLLDGASRLVRFVRHQGQTRK